MTDDRERCEDPMFQMRQILLISVALAALVTAWLIVPTSSTANEQYPLRIGFPPWISYDVVIYAQEMGLFADRGLDVELVRFDETSDVARAVMEGSIDAGFSSIGTVIRNSDGTPLKVVLITNTSAGADGIVARPGIGTLTDLRGHRIACKQKATNRIILAEALNHAGLRPDDVTITDVSNKTAEQMLLSGQTDAAVLWEPDLSRVAEAIGGEVVYRTSEIESLVLDMLWVRSDTLADREPQFEAIREAWFELLEHIDHHPHDVFSLVGERLRTDPLSLAMTWDGTKPGDRDLNAGFEDVVERVSVLLDQDPPQTLRSWPIPSETEATE